MRWLTEAVAFQTAVALAIDDSRTAIQAKSSGDDVIPMIKERHLEQVVSMSAAFRKYVKETHGGLDDRDYAKKLGNRVDSNFGAARAMKPAGVS